jgi:protein-arginine kinase activator protein McsA
MKAEWPDLSFGPNKTKVCKTCLQEKDLTYFAIQKGAKLGVRNYCKTCVNIKSTTNYMKKEKKPLQTREDSLQKKRIWYAGNKERNKNNRLRKVYGISLEQYNFLVNLQTGQCACCQKPTKLLYVDHCHETGKIRGLLCQQCNAGIGLLGDTLTDIEKAVAYLKGTYGQDYLE